ncbi:MAG TPA: prephenate dehydratase [Alphaproteobacteria bacterium]
MKLKIKPKKIAFQGQPGANSDLACQAVFPGIETLPCASFEDAFAAVQSGKADLAMIAIENNLAGRVADVHHLLPGSGLFIVGEHYQPIRFHLMAAKGASLKTVKRVYSHVMALPQCRKVIKDLKLKQIVHEDTAGAAKKMAEDKDPTQAALAPELAAKIYGLTILKKDVQDRDDNITRFIILSRKAEIPAKGQKVVTGFVFGVRHLPAALYKALGGFATNGVNLTKLESYVGPGFKAAEFYCEVEGHPADRAMELAFEELGFYASSITILGTFPRKSVK